MQVLLDEEKETYTYKLKPGFTQVSLYSIVKTTGRHFLLIFQILLLFHALKLNFLHVENANPHFIIFKFCFILYLGKRLKIVHYNIFASFLLRIINLR